MINFTYKNNLNKMIIFKCIGSKNFYIEKVLFPFETLIIKVPNKSKIEIWGNSISPKVEKRITVSSNSN